MVTPPRDLTPDAPGLAPLSPPGPPQPIDSHSLDALSMLPHEVQVALSRGGLDFMASAQAKGESEYSLRRMRNMFSRIVREFYILEIRKAEGLGIAVDITTR